MKKFRQIIALILSFCIIYTGLGFAEVYYSCTKCVDESSSKLASIFYPTRFIATSCAQCQCGCSDENVSCTCGKNSMPGQQDQESSTNHGNCISVSINKREASNDFFSIDIPQATFFTLMTSFCETTTETFCYTERPPIEFPVFLSSRPTSRFYLNLHCSFLI